MVTDIYGEGGSGKTQLCFTLCGRNAKLFENNDDIAVVFVDTSGTFRPERITEIAADGREEILDKILVVRALSAADQVRSIEKIADINPRLLIIDGVASLFTVDLHGIARHLALMNHLHNLSLAAINLGCPVVVTNMIRSFMNNTVQKYVSRRNHEEKPFQHDFGRELMGGSVSIYAHMKLMLQIVQSDKHLFRAVLKQPRNINHAYYTITRAGVSDVPWP
jgi:RecA/RadA recombinase